MYVAHIFFTFLSYDDIFKVHGFPSLVVTITVVKIKFLFLRTTGCIIGFAGFVTVFVTIYESVS